MRKALIITCAALLLAALSTDSALRAADKTFTVVIDAGHGGKDPGAIGRISKEKDLNLSVSLLAGKLIQEAYPDVKVLYTRKTDVFIPLQGRADFVNKNNADLFICIHTNSAENKKVAGAETFVLGTDRMEANLDVAMRENAVIKLETDYQTAYQGFDPNSIDSYIMFELMQNTYMDQSLQFATLLQQQFSGTLSRADRGVRQAAFWVLLKSACPSVLIEMGFISNTEEEKYLASAAGQQQMAEAILNAFRGFYRKSAPAEPPVVQEDTVPQPTEPAPKVTKKTDKNKKQYAVQIFASRTERSANDPQLKDLPGVGYFLSNGWYKYYCGKTTDRAAAEQTKKDIKQRFPDCFVIQLKE